jgi:hypothetical protein
MPGIVKHQAPQQGLARRSPTGIGGKKGQHTLERDVLP